MRYITGLDLHHVVTFKEVSVDFKPGLTYVRGLNLDSDPADPTSNGSGKTLLFSSIVNCLKQTTPQATKKREKKVLLRNKKSSIGVILRPSADGPEYEIIQQSSGYKIYEDGEDLKVRTIPIAEAYINKVFPLSELKFYSTCFLSTQRPYALQRDSNANRLQYFTDLFNLDQYSSVHKALSIKHRAIKDNEVKLSVLEQQRVALRRKLKELDPGCTQEEYQEAKTLYETCETEIESLQQRAYTLATQVRDLEALLDIERNLDKLRSQYSFSEKPGSLLKKFKKARADIVVWEKWRNKSEQVSEIRGKIEARIAKMTKPSVKADRLKEQKKELSARLSKLDEAIASANHAKKQYAKHQERIAETEKAYQELGVESIPKGDLEAEIAVAKAAIKLEKILEHAGEDSKCPTCQSELDLDAIKTTVAAAKKKLAKLTKYAEAAKLAKKLKELKSENVEYDADSLDKLRKKQSRLTTELEECASSLEEAATYARLCQERDALTLPEKPDCDEPQYSLSEIDEHIDLCSSIVDALSSKDVLLSNHPDFANLRSEKSVRSALKSVKQQEEALEGKLAKLRSRQSKASTLVSAYEQFRHTQKVYKTELADLELKIKKLSVGVEDKKLIEILLKAYGTKGLRASAADSVCHLLQTNLNFYRDLIFAEPFTFTVKASESGVAILVDRNNGKADSESDVRHLSGAESNSFQLLCLISLLPLLPDQDRVNLVILDEPTSHMCEVSRAIFNERYVPVLREIVPTVFIITPHSDDVCPNSSEWIVRKQGGVSTLEVR